MKFESIPFNTIPKTRRMFAHTPDGWVDITSSGETKHIKISVRTVKDANDLNVLEAHVKEAPQAFIEDFGWLLVNRNDERNDWI